MSHDENKTRVLEHLGRLRSGRDFLPLENDTLQNPPWEKSTLRILISRLSPSRDVEESVSHLVLYRELRDALPQAYLDFAFAPDRRERKVLEELGLPVWIGCASFAPASDFDLILVSCSYVLECLNLAPLMAGVGLPALARDRQGGDWPLLLAGGSSSLMLQGLLDRVEGLYTADFEGLAPALCRALDGAVGLDRKPRNEKLGPLLREIPGMVHAGPQGEARGGKSAPDGVFAATPGGIQAFAQKESSYPVLNNAHADTVRLMISLGCPYRCSFCFEGAVRKPYGELDLETLGDSGVHLRKLTGAQSVDLLSFNFNTHRSLIPLVDRLMDTFPFVHLMSQRLDILYRRPELLQAQLAAGKRSFTLGMEGISARMRKFFRKDLDQACVEGIIPLLLKAGCREVKCFYILSGYENDADFAEFARFVERVMDARKALGTHASILFSFGYLSVMPHTPLSRLPVRLDPAAFKSIQARVQEISQASGGDFRLAFDEASWVIGQFLSLAPAQAAQDFVEACARAGISFDEGLPASALGLLRRQESIPTADWVSGIWTVPSPHPLEPWCAPGILKARDAGWEAVKELMEEPLAPAAPEFDSAGPASLPFSASSRREEDLLALRAIQTRELARRKPDQIWVCLKIPREFAGAVDAWLCAWLSRRILALPGGQSLGRVSLAPQAGRGKPGLVPWAWGEGIFCLNLKEGYEADSLAEVLAHSGLADLEIRTAGPFDESSVQNYDCSLNLPRMDLRQLQSGLQKALEAHHVPVMLQKRSDGFEFVVSPKQMKKSPVKSLRVWTEDQKEPGTGRPGILVEICVLSRFELGEFIKQALPSLKHHFMPVGFRINAGV